MQNTKLILIEGIPGSGKPTLAQFIAHTLARQGIAGHWLWKIPLEIGLHTSKMF
ncbi:MAG: hypothetical protein WCD86_26350 [Ktedonobacteraceae bacterium]